MNKYAIIKIGPFQYKVEEGVEYTVPKFEAEEGKKLTITEVLAIGEEKGITIGKPFVDKAKVELEIKAQAKGEKVVNQVYKAKSRYRRKRGHRKQVTKFLVSKIS